jgi:hypothetical protein
LEAGVRARTLAALAVVLLAAGCAAKRPVLYPNRHLQQVGETAAQAEIDECIRLAEAYDADPGRAGKVAERTVEGAAVGGASGAAAGAVLGSAGRGAGAGAAAGAAGGFVRGLFRGRQPDPIHRRFVEHCLRDAGYAVIGWR